MNPRIEKLRNESFSAEPCISIERALLETVFYKENYGRYSMPVMRALTFKHLCEKKTIYIGDDELIVGERGPFPKAVPTFPELTCHSAEDLRTLNDRKMTRFAISDDDIHTYEQEVIPYWRGKSMRDRVFSQVPEEWQDAYRAGLFTEFMEQRAPGHTSLDGIIYEKGMLDFKKDIRQTLAALDYLNDQEATDKAEELKAMEIACDAAIVFAERHAALADTMAASETDPERKAELQQVVRICRRVPAHAPQNFWEAIQMYWFVHLGTITELNGWDAMSPGHLDQHLFPFYLRGQSEKTLDHEKAKELLSCFWIKFNNHPAPPKVGVTAKESGTYNDFTNINLGGLMRDGRDGVNEVSYLILEVIDELHLLQPQSNVQISEKTPDRFLQQAGRVISKGYGYPSVFNADAVVMEQTRVGKSIEDAREGGCSGCIETGAFGKEAYILTGYLNVPKLLELALCNGVDPLSGKLVGVKTGDPMTFETLDDLYEAFERQLLHIVDMKIRVNNYIERMFAVNAPAPFLSVVIRDCIKNGKDYYNGGPRYNTNYIQCCGIGTITDSLSAIKKHVFEDKTLTMEALLDALRLNFREQEALRLRLLNKTPFFGNDDDRADTIMQRVYDSLFNAIDGKPNTKGSSYHLNMLSTTCHIYFGKMLGATPNGRFAEKPISDGTSPSHGADRHGPTAVIKSLSKMDQIKSGGTLLNQRFLPSALGKDEDIVNLSHLIRTYFKLKGHHIQFNVVGTDTLKKAQTAPDDYRDLLVRVAGYSDYFVDLDEFHQEEIIERTEHEVI
ncbi:MAG: formate C-acetyltransferase/glycerol dehydratase family glycyl radical enzyme [Deltaproteobacteria bacterium]|nr:MAG: formate C-acetyltransferase/glycerol dehydratase family glycyl radical enzyme [Deltaproteobacteria bacterium]RLC17838.1 MAG: formate C-acetyltransferase/glycerol dehydratase family glycyl radical enzyme [Deltaproteobacteria bacterium]